MYSGQRSMNFLIFNKILPVLYIEGADFKSDIVFRKFRAQKPKFVILGQKVSTF